MSKYPHGKISGDDEGEIRIMLAADCEHNVVRIDFGKAVHWLALDVESAEGFIQMLEAKVDELKAG